MSSNSETASGSALAADTLTNANKDLVHNPLHGLALSNALDLSGISDRGSNQGSIRPPRTSLFSNRNNSASRDSIIREEPRISYKKTNEIVRILLEFNGNNISVNRFIRECREAENFVNPSDRDFIMKLVKARVTGEASDYLQFKSFDNLDQLLLELKSFFT